MCPSFSQYNLIIIIISINLTNFAHRCNLLQKFNWLLQLDIVINKAYEIRKHFTAINIELLSIFNSIENVN